MLALADALPDRVTAGWNQFLCTAARRRRPAHAAPSVSLLDLPARRPRRDAGRRRLRRARLHRHAGVMRSPDMEMFELSTPHFMDYYEYLPDSAGAGEWRGGYGTRSSWRFYGERRARRRRSATTAPPRAPIPAPGLFGGEPAGLNELRLTLPDGTVRDWGSKEIVHDIPPGTVCDRPQRRRRRLRRPAAPRPAARARRGARRPADAGKARARSTASPCADGASGYDEAETARLRGGGGAMSYRLGIDVGGTFTDFLLLGDDVAARAQDELDPRRPVASASSRGLAEIAGAARLRRSRALHRRASS